MFHLIVVTTVAIASPASQDATGRTASAPREENVVIEGKKVDEQKRRVCKRAVATGSIMTKSTCKTVAEWELERERSMAQAEQMRQRSLMEAEVRRQKFDE